MYLQYKKNVLNIEFNLTSEQSGMSLLTITLITNIGATTFALSDG